MTTEEGTAEDGYEVKWIAWSGRRTPVVTQNQNGPCPLISLVNALILRGKTAGGLDISANYVPSERLLAYVGNVIVESAKGVSGETRMDYEANVNDAIAVLPKTRSGLDVNVKFTGVKSFEYTPECLIYDLLDISLYHGWLVDPHDEAEASGAIRDLSYNQLVEKIIADKNSEDGNLVGEALAAQRFLETSASQLTYYGLCELNAAMREGEIAVFFRNNHFSTIVKEKGALYLLVTDQGFLKEPEVVWETLDSVDGDVMYVNDSFRAASVEGEAAKEPLTEERQIDQDHLLAMTLSEEEQSTPTNSPIQDQLGDTAGMSDEEIAKRLQELEQSSGFDTERRQIEPTNRNQNPSNGQRRNCIIL